MRFLSFSSFVSLSLEFRIFPGLSSKSFQGFHDLQEIQCSGENLPQDSDLMAMVLYEAISNNILAVANLRKMECSTSSKYVACQLDGTDTRKSKLKALVDDLDEGQSRVYGCNVSAFASGIRMEALSWSITVHHISELTFICAFTGVGCCLFYVYFVCLLLFFLQT